MKILILRHTLLNRGGDKMIVSHANHLAANGHEVTIQADRVDTLFAVDPRVRFLPIPWKSKAGTLAYALLRHDRYDRVIADIIPLALLLAVLNRRSVVYYAQDYDEAYYSTLAQKLFIRTLYWIGLRILGIRTISVSRRIAETFLSRFAHRATVVENGVDPATFHPDPDPDLLELKEGRKAILLMSRSDRRKGFDLALEVVRRLPEVAAGEVEVWTVGERTAELPKGVLHRDLGYLGGKALARVMSSADLFLYPSRHEGFPLMVVEAFACGCPVVTTEAVYFAVDGDNAVVAPIEDLDRLTAACKALLADPETARRLAAEGSRFAGRHQMADTLKNFASALETVLLTNV